MSNTVLPNTFQCYNLYIDRLLEHLTDSEVRILWYATRHILGWQDKIKTRRGHISLSMFEHGFTDSSGNHYGGCGLGKAAIIAACKMLVEFKLLEKCGEPTEDGQAWELTTSDIQWDKLNARSGERQQKQKAKTQKATSAKIDKRAGTSDVPENESGEGGTSDVTMQGTSHVTMLGTCDDTESNPLSNPSSNPEENTNTSAPIGTDPAPVPQTEVKPSAFKGFVETLDIDVDTVESTSEKITPPDDAPVPRAKPINYYQEAVKVAYKIGFGSFNGLMVNYFTCSEKNKGDWKEWQPDNPATPDEIVGFCDWYATKYPKQYKDNGMTPPKSPKTISPRLMEFRDQPDYETYVSRSGAAFRARLGEVAEDQQRDELPPPDATQADRINDIIERMARGEAINEFATL